MPYRENAYMDTKKTVAELMSERAMVLEKENIRKHKESVKRLNKETVGVYSNILLNLQSGNAPIKVSEDRLSYRVKLSAILSSSDTSYDTQLLSRLLVKDGFAVVDLNGHGHIFISWPRPKECIPEEIEEVKVSKRRWWGWKK